MVSSFYLSIIVFGFSSFINVRLMIRPSKSQIKKVSNKILEEFDEKYPMNIILIKEPSEATFHLSPLPNNVIYPLELTKHDNNSLKSTIQKLNIMMRDANVDSRLIKYLHPIVNTLTHESLDGINSNLNKQYIGLYEVLKYCEDKEQAAELESYFIQG